MKHISLPLGHPTIYIGDECPPILEIDGLIYCRALAPDNLLFPVLPVTINGKLVFTLCFTCATTQSSTRCMHTDEERSLTGCWVSSELKLAIKYGYRILETYEAWCYTETAKYSPQNDGIFSKYINAILKFKQQSSGYPSWCVTEAQKDEYIKFYEEHEQIKLNKEDIKRNEVDRTVMKLLLNSLWGQFFI